jgi:hypothetical protein
MTGLGKRRAGVKEKGVRLPQAFIATPDQSKLVATSAGILAFGRREN